jgi:hypothetical protein
MQQDERNGFWGMNRNRSRRYHHEPQRIFARESLMKFAYTWRTQKPENKKAALKSGLTD